MAENQYAIILMLFIFHSAKAVFKLQNHNCQKTDDKIFDLYMAVNLLENNLVNYQRNPSITWEAI